MANKKSYDVDTLEINVLSQKQYESIQSFDKTALYLTPDDILFLRGAGNESIVSVVTYEGNNPDGRLTQPIAYGRSSMAIGPYCQVGYVSDDPRKADIDKLIEGNEDKSIDTSKNYPLWMGDFAVSLGYDNTVLGGSAFAANRKNFAIGDQSAAFGNGTYAIGRHSFVAGSNKTTAGGVSSAAFGNVVKVNGDYAFGFGDSNEALGKCSGVMGYKCKSIGTHSFAGGYTSTAGADGSNYAFAYGHTVVASGAASFAMGSKSTAGYAYSIAMGLGLSTSATSQAVFGKYNVANSKAVFIVGFGTSATSPKNLFEVNNDGTATVGLGPKKALDVATKQYVDDKFDGLDIEIPTVYDELTVNRLTLFADGDRGTYLTVDGHDEDEHPEVWFYGSHGDESVNLYGINSLYIKSLSNGMTTMEFNSDSAVIDFISSKGDVRLKHITVDTPTESYQPTTKQYVDDKIKNIDIESMVEEILESYGVAEGGSF